MNYIINKRHFNNLDEVCYITLRDRIKLLFTPMSKYYCQEEHIIMHYKRDKKGNTYIFKQDFIKKEISQ